MLFQEDFWAHRFVRSFVRPFVAGRRQITALKAELAASRRQESLAMVRADGLRREVDYTVHKETGRRSFASCFFAKRGGGAHHHRF